MSEASPGLPATCDSPRSIVNDPLAQARREASVALFTIAALLVGFAVLLLVMPRLLGATVDVVQRLRELGWLLGLAIVFAATGVWARYSPLPAAVVGLVLYLLLAVLSLAVGLVLILLAVLLVKAIRTCVKARRGPA